jgi:hypothetical protein
MFGRATHRLHSLIRNLLRHAIGDVGSGKVLFEFMAGHDGNPKTPVCVEGLIRNIYENLKRHYLERIVVMAV